MDEVNWTMKRWAHYYIDHTPFRVFPLARGDKVPLAGSRGFYDATRDHARIEELWADPDYNIAVRCGDGLLVIDLDCKHEGEDGFGTLRELERDAGKIPEETWTGLTTTKGNHIYFHADVSTKSDNHTLYPDIDIHSNDSYIILPPSRLKNGLEYTWEIAPWDCRIAKANEAVKRLFIDPLIEKPEEKKERLHIPLVIESGLRNGTLFRAACYMQGAGFPDEIIENAIRDLNNMCCDPALSEREVSRLINSALKEKYEKGGKLAKWKEQTQLEQLEFLQDLKNRHSIK